MPALVAFSWKLHSLVLQLLDSRKQLNTQCWLPWENKICGQESSLCCATVPVTCQMAPASSAKLVKSFWNWQIFFQLKPCRAKPNTCWQSKVQTGICFGDQSNAILLFFFLRKIKNELWRYLRKYKIKLFLCMNKCSGSEHQMLLPQLGYFWIILFGSGSVSLLRDLPDKLKVNSKT